MLISMTDMSRRWRWIVFIFYVSVFVGLVAVVFYFTSAVFLVVTFAFVVAFSSLQFVAYLRHEKIRMGLTDRESAEVVLAQFPGPATVQALPVVRWAGRLAFFGFFLSGFVLAPVESLWLLLGFAYIDSRLTVDAQGFTVNGTRYRDGPRYLWADVTAFERVTYPGPFGGTYVNFYAAGTFCNLGYPSHFASSTITTLMNEWRDRALKLQAAQSGPIPSSSAVRG